MNRTILNGKITVISDFFHSTHFYVLANCQNALSLFQCSAFTIALSVSEYLQKMCFMSLVAQADLKLGMYLRATLYS